MDELKTPQQWAELTGNVQNVAVKGDTPYTAAHLTADVLHGWTLYANSYGEEVKLTKSDYVAAVDASKQGIVFETASKFLQTKHREPIALKKPEAMTIDEGSN